LRGLAFETAREFGPANSICTKVAFKRSRTPSSAVAARSSCVNRAMMGAGVPAGAIMPHHGNMVAAG
jgi:hypothetical protein